MNNISKKLFALLMAVIMVVSMLPVSALNVAAATEYVKATSIAEGDTVVLVYETGKKELSAISTTSTKYGIGADYSNTPDGAMPLEVVAGSATGTVAFKNGSNYLTWTSGNSLNVSTTLSANTSWNVSFDADGNATVANAADSTRTIRWNTGSPRFACYTSGQQAIQIYKLATSSCDHDYQSEVITAATCTGTGEVKYTCSLCSDSYTETVAATGHNFVNGVCSVCKAKQPTKATTIAVGDTVYIVCEGKKYEMSEFEGTSYAKGEAYTSAPAGLYAWTIAAGASDGTYAFVNSENAYMAWSSSNSLKTATALNTNSSWNVSFDEEGNAVITNAADATRKLQWNNSNPRFACYTSAQTAIQLYKVVPACEEHSWGEGVVTTAPGCESEGVKTFTCTVCSETYTESVEATGHSYGAGVVTTRPTADAEGVMTYTCSACSGTKTAAIVKLVNDPHKLHAYGTSYMSGSTKVTDPDAYYGEAKQFTSMNLTTSHKISVNLYDKGASDAAGKTVVYPIGAVSAADVKLNQGYQTYSFTFTVPTGLSDNLPFVYFVDSWGVNCPQMAKDLKALEGETVTVTMSMKAEGTTTNATLYFDKLQILDTCAANRDGAYCSKCGKEIPVNYAAHNLHPYDYWRFGGSNNEVDDPEAVGGKAKTFTGMNLSDGMKVYIYDKGASDAAGKTVVYHTGTFVASEFKLNSGYRDYEMIIDVPANLSDNIPYFYLDDNWSFNCAMMGLDIRSYKGQTVKVSFTLKITGDSLSSATVYASGAAIRSLCTYDGSGYCPVCGAQLPNPHIVQSDNYTTTGAWDNGKTGVADSNSANGCVIKFADQSLSSGFDFYVDTSATSMGKLAFADMKADGAYHTYDITLEVPAAYPSTHSYVYFSSSWAVRNWLLDDTLKAYAGKTVTLKLSMMINNPHTIIKDEKEVAVYDVYIDEMILLDHCEDYFVNGYCSKCGAADKRLPEDLYTSNPKHITRYDADDIALKDGNEKRVDDAESPLGKAWKAELRFDEGLDFYRHAAKTSTTAEQNIKIAKIAYADIKQDAGYCFYKYTVTVPKDIIAPGTYTYLDWRCLNTALAQDMVAYAGKTVDIYLSMKVTDVYTRTSDNAILGQVYVDQMILATDCDDCWDAGAITTEPGCESEGVKTYTCTACGATKTEVVAATGHSYSAVVTNPTCTEEGYTTHTCSGCGDSYIDTFVDATGHAWGTGVITTEPTYETEGVMTYTCGTCGETKTETVPMLRSGELSFEYRYGTSTLIQINTDLPSDTPLANFTADQNGCSIDQSKNTVQWVGWIGMDNVDGTIVLTFHFNNAFEAGQTYVLPLGAVFGFTDQSKYTLDKNYEFTFDGSNWTMDTQEKEITLDYRWGNANTIQFNTDLPATTPCVNFLATDNGCNLIQSGNQQFGWAGMVDADGTIVITLNFNSAFTYGQSYTLGKGSVFGFTDGSIYELYEDVTLYWDGTSWTTTQPTHSCDDNWDEGVITTEPTYETEGVKTFTCKVCGATKTEPVAKLEGFPGTGTAEDPYVISNLNQLKQLRDEVNAGNSYSGKIIVLGADIDLGNEEWTPIGNSTNKFQGTFDGQDHIISNLYINQPSTSYVGLFGFTTNGAIKNLTLENANVTGRLGVGAVAGSPYTSKYTNITLTGHVEINGMAYVGGVGGRNAYASWDNITVNVDDTSYVKANSVEDGTAYRTYVGGVIGFNGEGNHTFTNITSNIDVIGSTCDIGGIFGIIHYSNTVENVACSASVKSEGAAEEIGGIAGVWHNAAGYTVTINNASFTGSVSDVNGAVENVEIVGAAYNADKESAENSGSLIIDGEEAWQCVAKIGNTRYQTLEAAISDAQDGDTVVLVADVTATSAIVIDKSITLDGNGHKLNTTASRAINVDTKNGTVTTKIENLEIIGGTGCQRGINIIDNAYANTPANVTLTNVKISGVSVYGIQLADSVGSGNTITIVDSEISSWIALNINGDNQTVTVENSTISGAAYSSVDKGNTITVAGENTVVLMNGGVLSAATSDGLTSHHCGFVKHPTSSIVLNGVQTQVAADGDPVIITGVAVLEGKAGTYTDLAEAFEAAQDGDTIVLLRDIVTNETYTVADGVSITLDMNDKTITATDEKASGNYELFYILGEMTVTGNGTIELTALTDRDWNAMSAIFHNRGGVLTIENGSFTHLGGSDMAYVVDNSGNSYGDATTNIKGGSLTSSYIGIRNRMDTYAANGGGNGTPILNIEAGEISGKYAVWGQVSSTGCKGEINISGGKLSGWTDKVALLVDTDDTGDIKTAVSGGIFSSAVPEEYCAEGFVPVKNSDGTYGVFEGSYVAQIGEVKYTSLQDALNVGGEIVILEDIVLTDTVTVPAGVKATLNLNGKTISQEKACTASYSMIVNRGELTITGNGKISFTDTGAGDSSFGWGSYTLSNHGTLVVENGTIENLSAQNQGSVVHMYCAIQQGHGAVSTTINGGTISTPNYRSIRINAGALIVNGGNCEGQIWLQPNQSDVTMTITGGSFAPRGVDGSSVFMTNAGEGKEITSVSISGGNFATKIGCTDADALAGCITGGTYTYAAVSKTDPALLATGFGLVQNSDGTFNVVAAPERPTATVTELDKEDLTFALNFVADSATDEQLAYYGAWYADFVLKVNKDVTFNANGGADGYLSGQYDAWSENWVSVPFEDVTLAANTELKIMEYAAQMMGQSGLKLTYAEIYDLVKNFNCGVAFTPEYLKANPDLVVTLELRMYNYVDESESYVIGETYTFKFEAPERPTASVTEIENDDLTFAMNFKTDDATDKQLFYYGNWYADFVLKVNKDVTFNANGGADGYLSGQYDAWSENWVNVPFEDVTLAANTELRIMEYAAQLMGEPGLKYTYKEIYEFVKDFDCGVYFTPEFLNANRDLVVTLELRMYNNADESESYVIGQTYVFKFEVPELPTATAVETENDDLTFAMNFKTDEVTDEQLDFYGNWYADFVLKINKDVTFNANGGADGYLSGQYDAWSENWVNVPFEDVTLAANTELKIMEYAAQLMGEPGLKYTYKEVYEFVKDFDCGVLFTNEYLMANPDLVVTLELRMYNNLDESENYVIGETYIFTNQAVAYNVEQNIIYNDLIVALNEAAAGETVKLLKNVEGLKAVTVYEETILDLNGYSLTAQYYSCFGDTVDNSEANTGLLNVATNRILMEEDNAQIAVRTANGYMFFQVIKMNSMLQDNGAKYIFQPVFEEAAHQYLLTAEGLESVKIKVNISWTNTNGIARTQVVEYDTQYVETVLNSYDAATGKYSQAYYLTLVNAAYYDNLEYVAYVYSELDVSCYA